MTETFPPTGPRIRERAVEFTTPWFSIVGKTVIEAMDGEQTSRYYALQTDDYVTILALSDDGRVPMVRQYRPAVEAVTLELPSGHIAPGEQPDAAARRELREETGFVAAHVELLGVLRPDTGRLENRLWCYVATGLAPGQPSEERLDVVLYPRGDMMAAIASGVVSHALDLAVVMMAVARGRWDTRDD